MVSALFMNMALTALFASLTTASGTNPLARARADTRDPAIRYQRADLDRLLERLLSYRIFPDGEGRMNLSIRDIPNGGLLLVPQFTLAADTHKGTRAGFSTAAPPELARG